MNIGFVADEQQLVTTSGSIAILNLNAQIDSLASRDGRDSAGRPPSAPQVVSQQAKLIDLLTLRGQVLGRIADYERADELADRLVCAAPKEGVALLARARARATLHRFSGALADLEAAERNGADRHTIEGELTAILQAVGCYADARVLALNAVERRPSFTTLGALAVLRGERGEVAEAECLFERARQSYRDVSPFPVASLDFRRGLMWLKDGDLGAARRWFIAAQQRVPAYAPALGHLAEVDAALGVREPSIERLRRLARSSDDPDYAASLSAVLRDVGRGDEADFWRAKAAARYDELLLSYPEAFTHHAVHFWATVGGDAKRGRRLALRDEATRAAHRAYAVRTFVLMPRADAATCQDPCD